MIGWFTYGSSCFICGSRVADVDAGLIVPYETAEEICADVLAGVLTETESILFTLALDRYNPRGDTRVEVNYVNYL